MPCRLGTSMSSSLGIDKRCPLFLIDAIVTAKSSRVLPLLSSMHISVLTLLCSLNEEAVSKNLDLIKLICIY